MRYQFVLNLKVAKEGDELSTVAISRYMVSIEKDWNEAAIRETIKALFLRAETDLTMEPPPLEDIEKVSQDTLGGVKEFIELQKKIYGKIIEKLS